MGIVGALLLIIFVISAILLIIIVLLQDEQGEGLGGIFGGGSATPFGSRSGNVLTKFTSILAALFLFGSLAIAWLNRTPESGNLLQRARIESLKEEEENWWVKTQDSGTQEQVNDENPQVGNEGGVTIELSSPTDSEANQGSSDQSSVNPSSSE